MAYFFFKNQSTVFALLDMYGLLFLPLQVLSMAYLIVYGLLSIGIFWKIYLTTQRKGIKVIDYTHCLTKKPQKFEPLVELLS